MTDEITAAVIALCAVLALALSYASMRAVVTRTRRTIQDLCS